MITQQDIIYFLLTDRFCDYDKNNNFDVKKDDIRRYHGGDFAGIIKKIPYLKYLGITAIWITPVYLSVGSVGESDGYHGYWALDFEKIDPHLYSKNKKIGEYSKEYLKNLCDILHENNIKVVLDIVVNHTGYHNDKYSNYKDKKIKDKWFNSEENKSDIVKSKLCGLPDINCANVDASDYLVNNVLDWIEETGIDALRMDTVKHVEGAFWHFFKSYVKGSHRDITLIGEDLEYDIEKISSYQKDHDFDTLFDFPLNSALKDVFIRNNSFRLLARPRLSDDETPGVLDMDRNYTNANRLVTLLDNHDIGKRYISEIFDEVGEWDKDLAKEIFKLSLLFIFTTRGVPQLYYGTEIALEGGSEPDNRKDMPWELFRNDYPEKLPEYKKEIFDYTRELIEIRKRNLSITTGYLFTLYVDKFIYAYMREFKGNTVIVVLNNGLCDMNLPLTIEIFKNSKIPKRIKDNIKEKGMSFKNLQNESENFTLDTDGCLSIQLNRKSGKVLLLS